MGFRKFVNDKLNEEKNIKYFMDKIYSEVESKLKSCDTEKELYDYLRGSNSKSFWLDISNILKNEKVDPYVIVSGVAYKSNEYYGKEFCGYLNKMIGSRKRKGQWDYIKILDFYGHY